MSNSKGKTESNAVWSFQLLSNFRCDNEKIIIQKLLNSYSHVFATELEGVGQTDIVEYSDKVEGNHVVSQSPYRSQNVKR